MKASFHCAIGDLVAPLQHLLLSWGFADPNAEAPTFAGTYQRASASGCLLYILGKLLGLSGHQFFFRGTGKKEAQYAQNCSKRCFCEGSIPEISCHSALMYNEK